MREVGKNQGRWKLLGSEKWLTAHYENPRREPNLFSHSFYCVSWSFSPFEIHRTQTQMCTNMSAFSYLETFFFWCLRRRKNRNSSERMTKNLSKTWKSCLIKHEQFSVVFFTLISGKISGLVACSFLSITVVCFWLIGPLLSTSPHPAFEGFHLLYVQYFPRLFLITRAGVCTGQRLLFWQESYILFFFFLHCSLQYNPLVIYI